MFALEREALQAAVAAVGHNQQRRLGAGIDPEAVGTIDMVGVFAESRKGANELGVLVY